MKTTVSVKGQITIPKGLRRRLGIEPGTVLKCAEHKGCLVLEKELAQDPVGKAYGILKHLGKTTAEVLRALRSDGEDVQ